MDGRRFDAIAREAAAGATRRSVLKLLIGGVLGGLAGVRARDAGAVCIPFGVRCAGGTQCCTGNCVDNKCACRTGLTRCGDSCLNLLTNERNCGACGASCAAGRTCCNGRCADTNNNPNHCGACGRRCPTGVTCVNGACSSSGTACAVATDCPDDGNPCTVRRCTDGTCSYPPKRCLSDDNPCTFAACDPENGRCVQAQVVDGTRCGANGLCQRGSCEACDGSNTICPSGSSPGGNVCTNPTHDIDHCGSCNNRCLPIVMIGSGGEGINDTGGCCDGECCQRNEYCAGGICNKSGCKPVGAPCLEPTNCCSGNCASGACACAPTYVFGERYEMTCVTDSDCCSVPCNRRLGMCCKGSGYPGCG